MCSVYLKQVTTTNRPGAQTAPDPFWLTIPNCLRQIIIRVMLMCLSVYANIVCTRSGYPGPA
jgi:hypothetical protein